MGARFPAQLITLRPSFKFGNAGQENMPRLPPRYSPFVYGVIQAAITTGIATAIATYQATGLSSEFLPSWSSSWVLAWLTMLPIVIGISPMIQRAVVAVTQAD